MTSLRTIELCWVAFFTRAMAGLLFAMAGYDKVFVMTPRKPRTEILS
ncbi:MAG: hypothetical protein H0W76_05720 [Pyrinomonadaceae bacterium]|nr:hypothetical protein [Pyrinomonadaceae bacterium]